MTNSFTSVPEINLLAVFTAARAWLAKKEHWTKHAFFRNGTRHRANPGDTIAASCALGAAYMSYVDTKKAFHISKSLISFDERDAIATGLANYLPEGMWDNITSFNDSSATKHQDVLDLFDRAIAGEQKKELSLEGASA